MRPGVRARVCAAALVGAAGLAGQQPAGFQRLVWTEWPTDAVRLQRLRAAGFDGVQLPADADPAPVVAAGLCYYLDQPIGKGWLELRDRDFEPLRAAYERDRDPRVLVRPQCLRDPALRTDLGARAAAVAAKAAGPGLRFVALADEASATRHNNPLDLCRCARCGAAFREFALARHGSLAALNRAWGTGFATAAEVEPLTTDQLRRREFGGVLLPANLRPFADWLEFVDAGFVSAVAHLVAGVARAVPGVPVGLTGLQPPMAFGGHDYGLLLRDLTLVEPYDVGAAPRLCRSLRPEIDQWFTLPVPVAADPAFEAVATARLCAQAALGARGVVVWNEAALFAADGAVRPAAQGLQRALQRLRLPLDACAGAQLQTAPVWIVESAASVRAWWMLDSQADGMTWVRRLASHEATHSTSLQARHAWVLMLDDLGVTAAFQSERDLPERLLQQRPRVLVLPATVALSDRACQAIAAFVRQGGTVLADHSAALYDDGLVLRERGGLDEVFGITARSLRLEDLAVREGRSLEPRSLVAETGLEASVGESRGEQTVFAERRQGRGRAVYLNLAVCHYPRVRLDRAQVDVAVDLRRRVRQVLESAEVMPFCDVRGDGLPTCIERHDLRQRDGRRLLAVRFAALDDPELLRQLAKDGPRPVRLQFARPVQLRGLDGQDLGRRAEFDLQIDAHAGLFVEWVP